MNAETPDVAGVGVAPAPHPDEFDPPADTLGSQIARTDAALGAWRDESVRRRAEYDALIEEERLAADARRHRLGLAAMFFGTAGITTMVTIGLAATFVLATVPTGRPVAEVPAPILIAPPPAEVIAPPPAEVIAPPPAEVIAPPPAEGIAPPPPVEVAPPVVAAAAAPTLAEPLPVAAPGLPIVDGTAKVWSDARYTWVSFTAEQGVPILLHWRDASGADALEPMHCGSPRCTAGRSHARIRTALHDGAAPGTWTVEACGGPGCTVVGTFSSDG